MYISGISEEGMSILRRLHIGIGQKIPRISHLACEYEEKLRVANKVKNGQMVMEADLCWIKIVEDLISSNHYPALSIVADAVKIIEKVRDPEEREATFKRELSKLIETLPPSEPGNYSLFDLM